MFEASYRMGQATSGLTVRVGRVQLHQQSTVLSYTERGFGEHLWRLDLGVRLANLFFQTLGVTPTLAPWLATKPNQRAHMRVGLSWRHHWYQFPDWNQPLMATRYEQQRPAYFLAYDGEQPLYGLPLRWRCSRFITIFWAQPRVIRCAGGIALLVRAYNVTEPQVPRARAPQAGVRAAAPWANLAQRYQPSLAAWF